MGKKSFRNLFSPLQTKIILLICSIFIPLILFLVFNSNYTMNVVKEQVTASDRNTITLFVRQMDVNFLNIEKQITKISMGDTDLSLFESMGKGNEANYARQRLVRQLSESSLLYSPLDAMFIYSGKSGEMLDNIVSPDSYDIRERIREYVKHSMFAGGDFNISGWFPVTIAPSTYLFRIMKSGTVYVGAWVNVNTILKQYDTPDYVRKDYILIAANDGAPLSNAPPDFTHYRATASNASYTQQLTSGRTIVIGSPSVKGNFSLVALINENKILEGLPSLKWLIALFAMLILVLVAVLLYILRITVVNPISRMVKAMNGIQSGNWDTRIQDGRSSNEFHVLNKAFNSMAGEVQQLKIGIYEEKLMKQRAQLQYFQLQIRPHFLINTLNIIYNLAQAKEYQLIQEMTLYLVRYFQYTVKSTSPLVTFRDEIKHTENYLSIQKLRFPGILRTHVDVEEGILDCAIPPITIQTFVENSIKYAMTMDEPVDLYIRIGNHADKPGMLDLVIRDSGPGFPPEILELLRRGQRIKSERAEQHIGIYNVQQRLWLLFGEHAELKLYNAAEGGACTEIIMPRSDLGVDGP